MAYKYAIAAKPKNKNRLPIITIRLPVCAAKYMMAIGMNVKKIVVGKLPTANKREFRIRRLMSLSNLAIWGNA